MQTGEVLAKGKHIAKANKKARIHRGIFSKVVIPGCATLAVVGCLGFGIASAGNVAQVQDPATAPLSSSTAFASLGSNSSEEGFILETSATRDMDGAIAQVQAEEEQARIEAEQAEQAKQEEIIAKTQESQAKPNASSANATIGSVDFSVGKDAFIEEWTARIDAYLSGSTLDGYGATFAEAAWENGVDPRWSPAISTTESGKGANCFASHNAWGWSGFSWPDWVTAIHAHVKGLATIYGHTITYESAKIYCPPNYDHWYNTTLSEMARI